MVQTRHWQREYSAPEAKEEGEIPSPLLLILVALRWLEEIQIQFADHECIHANEVLHVHSHCDVPRSKPATIPFWHKRERWQGAFPVISPPRKRAAAPYI